MTRTICVYAGSSDGRDPAYVEAARAAGEALGRRGLRGVFGGGRRGLMGAFADAAMAAGAEVVGVIPEQLVRVEVGHHGLTELVTVSSMHERKRTMADLSDAFLALPGGIGTLEELVEVWTWTHLGFHDKPCGLLDVNGYYADLVRFFDRTVEEGFLRPESRDLLVVADDAETVVERLLAAQVPGHRRLIGGDAL